MSVNNTHRSDKWIAGDLSRPEAIRQLVEHALAPKPEGYCLGAELKSAIDAWMQGKDLSRSQAIAKLIELGLKANGNSA
jgi:hypothetical protein